jgi:threonine dehydrogenase-like Zn-dependent dehydrogenase
MADTRHTEEESCKEINHASSCYLRPARCAFRGARDAEDYPANRCHHQNLGHLRLRLRLPQPTPFGNEYCGIVEEVGSAVTSIKPGQFVIGSFFASDNTCPHCQAGYQSSCLRRELIGGAQAPMLRVPLADGTLVATPGVPSDDLIPSLLALSDVMGTGWFAADAANVSPGKIVAVVGDGAVGLLGVLSASSP